MGRGILDIPASAGTGGGGDFIRYLYMKQDKESALIRFLTEHDEIFFAQFHDINDPPFRDLCVKAEFGQVCRRCDKGNQPRMKFLAWVYTDSHDYIDEDDAKKAGDYDTIKLRGGRKVYRVDVEEVQLICFSAAHKGAIQRAAEKYGTLLDHDFELVRSGKPDDTRTQYLLEAGDKEEMSDELVDLMEELPDLDKVAAGEVETLGEEEEEEEEEEERPRKRAKKSRKSSRRVEEEDGEEEEDEKPRGKSRKTRRSRRAVKEDEDEDEEPEEEEPLF